MFKKQPTSHCSMKISNKVANYFGWVGASLILVAYALVSFAMLSSDSVAFQLLNFFGALGFIVMGHVRKVWPTLALNVIWAIVAVMALYHILI